MNRTTVFLAVATVVVLATYRAAHALYEVIDEGVWPKTWPAELEPLRKTSRTLEGPMIAHRHYEIPFTKREDFEAAWPHLLKVKSKSSPVILVRKPGVNVYDLKAGVIVHARPEGQDRKAHPEAPLPGQRDPRSTWMWTTYIELVADGQVVDLNRIPLPSDTPIVDERFRDLEEHEDRR